MRKKYRHQLEGSKILTVKIVDNNGDMNCQGNTMNIYGYDKPEH